LQAVQAPEILNQPVDAKLRVHFYKAMNLVGHAVLDPQRLRTTMPAIAGMALEAPCL
jgi:hypothetical protein